jgi:hypothetical protein
MREKNHPVPRSLMIRAVPWAACIVAAVLPAWGVDTRPGAGLVLLPLQDRTGSPDAAAVVEETFRQLLSIHHDLPDAVAVRDRLRRLRIRNPAAILPEFLKPFAPGDGRVRFFSTTLYRAEAGRYANVTVAARVLDPDSSRIVWSGFRAVCGRDSPGWFERGHLEDLSLVILEAVGDLVADFEGSGTVSKTLVEPAQHAFLRDLPSIEELGTIAVIPFENGTREIGAGEMVTDLAVAVLQRRGATLLAPGFVEEVIRRGRGVRFGGIDRQLRTTLGGVGEVDVFFTGMVEQFKVAAGGGVQEVALSARLVDARTGRILWMAGMEKRGSDPDTLFPLHRAWTTDQMAEEMMESLIASFAGKRPGDRGEEGR